MSATIDERVVQMKFDNKDFEKAVSVTLKSLDELQNALKLNGSSKGIQELQKSINSFETRIASSNVEALAEKFNKLGIVGVTALTNIANKAVDAGERLMKSLTVDNISAGWNKFAENTKNIGTIVSQGFSMDETEEEMKRLLFFTDETSYAYTDMVNNISKFTAAGKGLHESINAMQGIALWASSAGQGAQKASQAMYQLSQAMGSGLMRKEDWKSIQNLNMDTQEFRKMALEAAEGLGTLKKVGEDTWQSLVNPKAGEFKISQFADHLTEDKWFTDEVMMSVYERYNSAVQQIYDYVEQHGVSATQAIEELKDSIDPLALKWFKSAQEARTFGDAVEYVKEAVSTGWMRTFDAIFGNYEEATKLWTDLSEILYTVVVESGDVRNAILDIWKAMGGREYLLEAFNQAIEVLGSLLGPIKNAWDSFFPEKEGNGLREWAEGLFEITEGILDFIVGLRVTEDVSNKIQEGFTGLFSVVFMVADAFKALVSFVAPLGKPLNVLAYYLLEAFAALGRFLTGTREYINSSDVFVSVIDHIANAFQTAGLYLSVFVNLVGKLLIGAFQAATKAISDFTNYIRQIPILNAIFQALATAVQFVGDKLSPLLITLGSLFLALKPAIAIVAAIGAAIASVATTVAGAISVAMGAAPVIAIVAAIAAAIKFGSVLIAALPGLIGKVISTVQNLWSAISKTFNLSGIISGFNGAKTSIIGAIGKAKEFFNLKDKKSGIRSAVTTVGKAFDGLRAKIARSIPDLSGIKNAIGNLVAGLVNSLKSIRSFDDLKTKITNFIGSFVNVQKITDLLKNFGTAIQNLASNISPMFGRLGDIVSAGLMRIGELFINLKNNFDVTRVLQAIVRVFEAFGGSVLTAVGKLIPKLKEATDGIMAFLSGIGDKVGAALQNARMMERLFGSLFNTMDGVGTRSMQARTGVAAFFDAFRVGVDNFQSSIQHFIREKGLEGKIIALMNVLEKLKTYIMSLSPAQVVLFVFGLAITKFAIAFADSTRKITVSLGKIMDGAAQTTTIINDTIKNIGKSISGMFDSLAKIPGTIESSVKEIVKAIKGQNLATNILKFAIAIGILAASLYVLSTKTNPEQLAKTALVLAGLGLTLGFVVNMLGEMDSKDMLKKSIMIGTLAVSTVILAAALKILSTIPIDQIASGMVTLGVALFGMIKALEFIAVSAPVTAGALPALLGLALALDLIAAALIPLMLILNVVGPQGAAGALLTIAALLGGMRLVASQLAGIKAGAGIAILGVVASIFLLIAALKAIANSGINAKFVTEHLEEYALVFGALTLMMLLVSKMGAAIQGFSIAIAGVAIAVGILTKVVKKITELKFNNAEHFVASIRMFEELFGALLGLMVVAHFVGKTSMRMAASMILLAVAINVLALVFGTLKKLVETTDEDTLVKVETLFVIVASIMTALTFATQYTKGAKVGPIIAMLAGVVIIMTAIALLAQLPNVDDLAYVAIGLGVLFGVLGYALGQVAYASKVAKPGVVAGFVVIIGLLVAGLIYLTTQDWRAVVAAGGAMAAALVALGLCMFLLSKATVNAKDALKGAGIILLASIALIPAAFALRMLAGGHWDSIIEAALALGVVIGALAVASHFVGQALLAALTLDIASVSLVAAAFALSMLKGFDGNAVMDAATAMMFVLGAMAFASNAAVGAMLGALALDVAIPSMVAAALSLMVIANFPGDQLGQVALSLAGVLIALAGAAMFASGAILGAVALDIASISLVAAAGSLAALAALPIDGITTATLALVGVMGMLVVGGLVASLPMVAIGMVAFAGALFILSQAFLAIGQAALMFSTAVTQIVVALGMLGMMSSESITQIGDNLKALGAAIGESIAAVVQGFFTNMFAFIGNAASGIVNAILGVLGTIFGFKEDFGTAAGNMIAGLTEGVSAGWEAVKTAVSNIANGIIDTFKDILGIHSPSERLMELMHFLGLGTIEGLQNEEEPTAIAASSFGNNIIDTLKGLFTPEAGADAISGFISGMQASFSAGLAWIQDQASIAGLEVQGFFGDEEAKAEAEKKKEKAKLDAMIKKMRKVDAKDQKDEAKVFNDQMEKNRKKREKEEWKKALGGGKGGSGGGSGGSGAAEKATKETKKQIDMLTKITDYASGAISMFRVQWAETAMGLEDTTAQQASKDALELLAFQLYENSIASETAEEAAERMAKTQAEVAADIKKAYINMRNGVNESLRSSIDVFKMADNGEKIKGGDLLERARSNRTMVQGFTNDLKTLAERIQGMPGAFEIINKFAKEGTSSYGELGGMLDMTTDDLTEFMQYFYDLEVNPHELNEYTDSIMGSLAYVGSQAASGFSTGLNTEEGAAAAENYSNAVLDKFREKFGVNLQGDGVSEATKQIAEAAAKGFTETLQQSTEASKAEESGEKLGAGINKAVGGELSAANGSEIGKALCEGIAKGITENTQIAIDAATAMGLSVIDAVKTALQINSPSKVFEDLGYYSDAGLATGFVKYGTVVREAAAESALGAVDEFTGVFGQLADLIDGRIDLDPTIRPVLDLSNLTYGSDQINSLLGLNDPYPLNASVAGIQNSADLALQLGDSINKAINRLKETGDQARDIVIHIYPTENQSPEEIADAVSYRINHELYKKVAVRGGT